MCGIIAVIRRPSEREPAAPASILDRLDEVSRTLSAAGDLRAALEAAAVELEEADLLLRGVPGLQTMLADAAVTSALARRAESVIGTLAEIEAALDASTDVAQGEDLEAVNAALLACKDAVWAIRNDRLRAAREVAGLTATLPIAPGLGVLFSIHQALSALDRLEVRGRDSAGVEIQLLGHGLDPQDPWVRSQLEQRADPAFRSGAARIAGDTLLVVHKAAAEIGELGDNTAALRASLRDDELLHAALSSPTVDGVVLGHTRWASIGIISEANAHPQSSDELASDSGDGTDFVAPLVTGVLNGDVDNHADLTNAEMLRIAADITTDAKVIPTMMSRRLTQGSTPTEAFADTVRHLEGSVAIAATSETAPDRIHLALRGSGQAVYIGLAEDSYIVASEPYGVVEETDLYLRMDGETPSDAENPTASRGQIVEISINGAGTLDGLRRWSYDGTELPVADEDLQRAQVTTRDIDRGHFAHFLLKEITASPNSFRTTLRQKLVEGPGGAMEVHLDEHQLPPDVRERLRSGTVDRVLVIGQGTAAIAGQSLAHHLGDFLAETEVRVEPVLATELSGFQLRPDMSDTLVIAISQSGTTTDTNRTVDLVRGRGASVLAIVNRRGSDLTDKADGVLYTSDGRDVEMSVASTKAFYSQVAAGLLLAQAIADEVPGGARSDSPAQQELLSALADLPARMEETLQVRDAAAAAARAFCPSRRYWAIVGNGVNQIAAREIRVKLSELCYKSIACDGTEDKKHIDLSSEPLIVVCAAGLVGSTADDVAKEIAIFRAHKAAPIVIASEGDRSFPAALAVLSVPPTHPRLAFVLATMAGHLLGYEAALAIDEQARPLREARAAIETAVADVGGSLAGIASDGEELMRTLRPTLSRLAGGYFDAMRSGTLDGHLEASTAVRLAGQFRFATGISPLDAYQVEFGRVGTPGVVLEDLSSGLGDAIEELTRPVDAIKHQAKTVTVGISRSDESLLSAAFVAAVLDAGAPRDRLTYSTLKSLAELDPAIVSVNGYTRYGVEHGEDLERATVTVLDRGGIAAGLTSRAERDPRLRGTKALVAREQELMVARGRSDGRLVVIVPETKDTVTTGLMLLHVDIADRLPAATARSVLRGYRRRYQALKDAVTETEDVFRDDLLAEHDMADLLTVPILDLADRWRS